MSNFRVGQKVVCVTADSSLSPFGDGDMNGLTEGCVYTIRWLGPCPCSAIPCLRVEEIVRPNDPRFRKYDDMPYLAPRFRPVVEKKTDISIFTAMLTPHRQKELGEVEC